MKLRNIAVLGAGAVGSYILWGLRNTPDIKLYVVSEGERNARLKEKSLTVNSERLSLNVRTADELRDEIPEGPDLIIVAVKYISLQESLSDIERIAGDKTLVMSLLNGVDSEQIIKRVIPEERIITSLIKIASQRNGNSINFPVPAEGMGVIYGAETASQKDYINSIKELFDSGEIVHHVSDDIRKDLWLKYSINISQTIPQAILASGVGIFNKSQNADFLRTSLRSEVIKIAAHYGIDIDVDDSWSLDPSNGINPAARYSTLQDLDAGRRTEIDMLSGTVVRLGHELGIPVPYNEFAYHIVKALEERNESKFNF